MALTLLVGDQAQAISHPAAKADAVMAGALAVGSAGHTNFDRDRRSGVTTIRYGPFTVPGGMGEGEPGMLHNAIVPNVEKPCEDCYVTGIVPNLVDPVTGETINFDNGGMLHHVVNLNWSRSDVTCPAGPGPGIINWLGQIQGGNDRFYASGNERTVLRLPRGYGLPVSVADRWGLIVDLMNTTSQPRAMALEYTFTWTKRKLKPVTPAWLDIDNCNDSEFSVPTGYSDTHWDWDSTIGGRVIALGGHVHDNGISVAAENASSHRTICTSKAGYQTGSSFAPPGPGSGTDRLHPKRWWQMWRSDHPDADLAGYMGHIAGATGCTPHSKLAAGDTIRLHAQYNWSDHAHGHPDEVMGIMIAYVHERD